MMVGYSHRGQTSSLAQPLECLCGPASSFAFVSSHPATSTPVMPVVCQMLLSTQYVLCPGDVAVRLGGLTWDHMVSGIKVCTGI